MHEKILNSLWLRGEGLTLFEALTGGALNHLNYQHTREFDQNFSKKLDARHFDEGGGGGHGWF